MKPFMCHGFHTKRWNYEYQPNRCVIVIAQRRMYEHWMDVYNIHTRFTVGKFLHYDREQWINRNQQRNISSHSNESQTHFPVWFEWQEHNSNLINSQCGKFSDLCGKELWVLGNIKFLLVKWRLEYLDLWLGKTFKRINNSDEIYFFDWHWKFWLVREPIRDHELS